MNPSRRVSRWLVLSVPLWPLLAPAQVPPIINYQGRLLDGTNLVNGTVGLSLRLFNVPSGGSSVYEDSNSVTVADGLYSTFIGDNTTSGSLADALANTSLWIEVAVNGATLSPRERLAAAAYAVGAWNVNGNAGTSSNSFLGTTDRLTLELRAGGVRVLRAESMTNEIPGFNTVNLTLGSIVNEISTNSRAATISGGGMATYPNRMTNSFGGVIGGGYNNEVFSDRGTVAGGAFNRAGYDGAVGGGVGNVAGSLYSTVPGGVNNTATGLSSFAAGAGAHADHNYTLVWQGHDPQFTDTHSTGPEQFIVRADGGVGINTNNPHGKDLAVGGDAFVAGTLGVGVTNVQQTADFGGRIQVRGPAATFSAGMWLYDTTRGSNRSFVGVAGDGLVGFFGNPGASWGLVMNITNGNVGLGTLTPGYKLEVNGTAHRVDNSASWTTTSDRRLKTGIAPLGDALALLERVRPVTFFYTDPYRAAHPGLPGTRQYGVIAQDYAEVFPDFVTAGDDGYLAIDPSPLTFANTAALRDLAAQNAELRASNAELKSAIERLGARVAALEAR